MSKQESTSGTRRAGPFEVGGISDGDGMVIIGTAERTWALSVEEALRLWYALEHACDVAEGHCDGAS